MPESVSKVVIASYKYDFWLAEICMASVRYWYPEMPLAIVYDHSKGAVDFTKVKKRYGAEIIELPIKQFGWGLSKIEYLFQPGNEHVLVLDADTVLLGPVLEYLGEFEGDFVVSASKHDEPYALWMKQYYFDYEALQKMDPSFVFPGYSFNTGQFIATTGILQRSDFEQLVTWKEFPQIKHKHIFSCVDQGLLNYLLPLKEQQRQLKIGKADFMMGIRYKEAEEITVAGLRQKKGIPYILHWAGGGNTKTLQLMKRNDLLRFYRNQQESVLGIFILELEDWCRYAGFQWQRVIRKYKQKMHG
ncbi:hypothetical protein WG954_07450 [Lacibacter sp. H375]|uniref:hypothetical protein n=1 Tax=Lacibacter sp. H375 TaxID=3133424 RepID=UPI0030C11B9A